ncbi:MAG: hypothetical protein QNK33_07015 [Bacteroidales bacterium]|nr:hypothetical protein [Bacteroidales bacterium]
MNYRSVLLVLLTVFYLGAGVSNAQSVSESRILEQSFSVNKGMGLDVTNKYGKVHLSPSSNDSVYIRIEIDASASKSSKLRKLIDGVSFNLISTKNFVIAETKISRGPVNFLENIRSFTNNLISSEMKINIDYYISAPEYLKVKIDNRYGDVYIESSKAEIHIIASNGKIMAEDLLGQSSFDLNFCNADIGSLRDSKISLSYGEIKIDRAGEVRLTSTSSKIEIDDIETLITESKRDKYYIKNISSIEGNSYFTDYDIEILKERVNLTSRYGNLRIEQISHLFDIISVESTYTDLRLKTLPETSFELDAKLNNCYAIIPEEWLVEEKVLSNEREEYLYTGFIGTAKTTSKIILRLTRGELDIMQPTK